METSLFQIERNFYMFDKVGLCALTREDFFTKVFALPTIPVSATVNLIGIPGIVAAMENDKLAEIYNNCTIAAIDGMPLVNILKKKGLNCERCGAPDIMGMIFKKGIELGKSHFFYGGKNDEVLLKLRNNLEHQFPGISIAGMFSPPFRLPTKEEDEYICEMINQVKPDFLWIGIGAPKQEIWMDVHRNKIKGAIMLGVGAGFDFFAGTLQKSPKWMEKACLEWLFRLSKEPKRLWKRYVFGGLEFLFYDIQFRINRSIRSIE